MLKYMYFDHGETAHVFAFNIRVASYFRSRCLPSPFLKSSDGETLSTNVFTLSLPLVTMSTLALSAYANAYRWLLQPIPPFTWFGSSISSFDVGAALRLCVVLRQLREMGLQHYQKSERTRKSEASGSESRGKEVENASLIKSIAVTFVVVYGGEAIMSMSPREFRSLNQANGKYS